MSYGASESNSKEAMGLALLVAGISSWAAGWAYGESIFQIIFVILGLAGIFLGFSVLRAAKSVK